MSKRYDITCPACGHKMAVHKSILHEMGYAEYGRGCCLNCDTNMNLIYDRKKQTQ